MSRLPPLKSAKRPALSALGASSSAPSSLLGFGKTKSNKLLKLKKKLQLISQSGLAVTVKGGKQHHYHTHVAKGKCRTKNAFGNSTTFKEIRQGHKYYIEAYKPKKKAHATMNIEDLEKELSAASGKKGKAHVRSHRNSLMLFDSLEKKQSWLSSLNDTFIEKEKEKEMAKKRALRPGSAKKVRPGSSKIDEFKPEISAAMRDQHRIEDLHRIAQVGMSSIQKDKYWRRQRTLEAQDKRHQKLRDELAAVYNEQRQKLRNKRAESKIVLKKRLEEAEEQRQEAELNKRIKEAVLAKREQEKAIDIGQYLKDRYGGKF